MKATRPLRGQHALFKSYVVFRYTDKGQTVVFDASEKNVHSVDTIPRGERYTLLVWLADEHGEHNRKVHHMPFLQFFGRL